MIIIADLVYAINSVTQKKQKQKRTRVINHSFFQNVDYKEAERYLSQRLDGECVVRPSTKGNNHISITWRVYEGIYQHLDVLELQKENEWTLGKKLRIDELEFDDIDQIIAEYIEPITKRIKLMVQHPKFQKRSYDDMSILF
jgi:transcription elongation factor SPT6